jgi:ADP-heptose:LPS heptosyltransferase
VNIAVIVSGGAVETLQAALLVQSLHQSAPAGDGHHITVVCPPQSASLAQGIVGVSEVLPLAAMARGRGPASLLAGIVALRRRRLEAVLVCSDRPGVHLMAYLSGTAVRAGCATGAASLLFTHRILTAVGENRAATWLRLAAAVSPGGAPLVPYFNPGADAVVIADRRLFAAGVAERHPILVLAPGSGWTEASNGVPAAALAWEPERYAHLANLLRARHGASIVLLGSLEDRPAVDRILLDLDAPALDLCGQVDILTAVGVLIRCDLLVGGDGPLLHLAAAVGTPAVGIFGPTDGRRRGPFGPAHRVVQGIDARRPDRAIERVRVDDVLAGIENAL